MMPASNNGAKHNKEIRGDIALGWCVGVTLLYCVNVNDCTTPGTPLVPQSFGPKLTTPMS